MSEQRKTILIGRLKLFSTLLVIIIVGCKSQLEDDVSEVLTLPRNYYDNRYDHPNNFLADVKLKSGENLDGIFDLILEVERLSLEKYGQTSPVSLEYPPIKEILKLDPILKSYTLDSRTNMILIEHVTLSIKKLKRNKVEEGMVGD